MREFTYVFKSPYSMNSMTMYTGSFLVQTPSSLTIFLWSNLFIMSASLRKAIFSSRELPGFRVLTATATYNSNIIQYGKKHVLF